MNITDQLIEAIKRTKNPSVAGIDTAFSYLPEGMRAGVTDNKGAAKAILQFNREIIDALIDIVPAVKVQVAYYEAYGAYGMETFRDTLAYAKEKGLITISDVKRNDIGSTSAAYSSAYLGKNDLGLSAEFMSDYITVNGYLGIDGIKPFTDDCREYGKGIFALVRTSNPSSSEIQNVKTEKGEFIYEMMGGLVKKWGEGLIGKYGYSAVGAVVGATHREEAEILRKQLPNVFFLVPGYGAQGGKAEDLVVCFDNNGLGALVNSSRGILCAYQKSKLSPADAAREAAISMREDIVNALKAGGKTAWLK
jgi:orotidine-5'-phosphate decarboxylase